ncbi:glycosyltransferase [Xylanibacter ruminicola]|uniref:glycosyltransferase n=1 Tax=Xylanibacter ruminicola TaxID=839 RepID=UPI00094348E4|nr:glycosyltransferase [Xylanibacter ruminicola]
MAIWGGIERVLIDKMNYLSTQLGYDVYMLTTCQGRHVIPYALDTRVHLDDLGIQFHKQYQYKGLKRLVDSYLRTKLFEKRFKEKLHEILPDIIICTTSDPVYSIAKVKGKIPLIVESHSICKRTLFAKGCYQRFRTFLLRNGLQKSTCIVALTEGDAIEWRKIHPHVEVIPNVVHLNNGSLSSLTEKRVIFVGRFDYQKQPMEAIRIWKKVFSKHPDWHLEIYGEGEQEVDLIEKAKELNMNIHIHKPVGDIFDCYRHSSLLISTSLFEPLGLVIPEAMSCGLPVIAYDCSYGPASIILDGTNGFLVNMNDREAMISKINLLISNVSLRQYMGKKALLSSSQYSADIIMPLWKRLFASLVQ